MTPVRTGDPTPRRTLNVRLIVAEALYPGELSRLLENAQGLIAATLHGYGSRWVHRIGWDAAFSESLFGAMKGLVSWLLQGGPGEPVKVPTVQTFIIRGILYHFGSHVPWYVGPVRVNVREFTRDPAAAIQLTRPEPIENYTDAEAAPFVYEADALAAVDEDDSFRTLGAEVLAAAETADPDGSRDYKNVIDLRHGITSGLSMTFEEIGSVLGIRKQGAFQKYRKAVAAVRVVMSRVSR